MLIGDNHVKASQENQYFIDQTFLARIDAGAVTNQGRNFGTDLVWTRTGNGVYVGTFAAAKKPSAMKAFVNVRGNSNVTGNATYDASAGTVTVRLWAQAGGADNTAVTVDVLMLCSKSRSVS